MRKLAFAATAVFLVTASAVHAETVQVKYRGKIDLGPFKCTDVAQSTLVRRVCYDQAKSYMLINLRGVHYHYCGVDAATVAAFQKADPIAKYYYKSIRGHFDCRKHRIPKY